MKHSITAFISGILFSIGLAVSGMTDTHRILAFLDVFGDWEYQLLLVMASGIVVTTIGFRFIFRRPAPLFDQQFFLPDRNEIDKSLVTGALLFGVGWGLYGYCPGPAVAALSYGYSQTWVFLAALLAGMYGYSLYQSISKP